MVIKVQSHVRRFINSDVLYKRLTSIFKIQRLIRRYLKQQRELSSQNRRLKEQLRLEERNRIKEQKRIEEQLKKEDQKHIDEQLKKQIEFELIIKEQILMMKEEDRQKRYEYETKIKQNEDDLALFKATLNKGVNQKVEMANKMEELLLENHRIKLELSKKKSEKCIIS